MEAMDKAKKTMMWVGWGLSITLVSPLSAPRLARPRRPRPRPARAPPRPALLPARSRRRCCSCWVACAAGVPAPALPSLRCARATALLAHAAPTRPPAPQIIVWPLLALPAGVFSKGYFT